MTVRKYPGKSAPAFMFYASDAIADKRYRMMELEERGLYLSILCECWVNRDVPTNIKELAKWLSFDEDSIRKALTQRVRSFFEEAEEIFTSPDLERYRAELEHRRESQSKGGKKGVEIKRVKSMNVNNQASRLPDRVPQGPRVEGSGDEESKNESGMTHDYKEWSKDYESYTSGIDSELKCLRNLT